MGRDSRSDDEETLPPQKCELVVASFALAQFENPMQQLTSAAEQLVSNLSDRYRVSTDAVDRCSSP